MDIAKTLTKTAQKATANIAVVLAEMAKKREAAQKEAQDAAKQVLGPGLQAFMEEHPEITGLAWTQYTPYFNDGDTCEFSVCDLYVTIEGQEHEDFCGYDENGWESTYGLKLKVSSATIDAVRALEKALNDAEEELQAAFGDHVQVVVTKEGVDVSEYEHD